MKFLKRVFWFALLYIIPLVISISLGIGSFLFGMKEGSVNQSQQDSLLIKTCIYEYQELKAKVWDPQQETGMGFHADPSCADVCKLISRPTSVFVITESWATPNGKCACIVESSE